MSEQEDDVDFFPSEYALLHEEIRMLGSLL